MADLTQHKDYDPVLPLAKAAEYCGCHPDTLRKAVREREVAVVRNDTPGGRSQMKFRLSSINKWIKRHERPASRRASGE